MYKNPEYLPTPWAIRQREDKHKYPHIVGFNKYGAECPIADMCLTGREEANADLIVKAVNCHHELLNIVENWLTLEAHAHADECGGHDPKNCLYCEAQDLVNRIKGEETV